MITTERGADMNAIVLLIIACEVAFWIVIGAGLVTRYLLKKERLGLFLLALTPVVDVILLVATSIDLYQGATATTAHAIAAIYIGVSIAFGKSMIDWADENFRYYITKQGEKPIKRYGMEHAKHYVKSFVRHVVAFIIGAGLLVGMIYYVNDASRTEALMGTLRIWGIVIGVDLLITLSYFIWPRENKKTVK